MLTVVLGHHASNGKSTPGAYHVNMDLVYLDNNATTRPAPEVVPQGKQSKCQGLYVVESYFVRRFRLSVLHDGVQRCTVVRFSASALVRDPEPRHLAPERRGRDSEDVGRLLAAGMRDPARGPS